MPPALHHKRLDDAQREQLARFLDGMYHGRVSDWHQLRTTYGRVRVEAETGRVRSAHLFDVTDSDPAARFEGYAWTGGEAGFRSGGTIQGPSHRK